LALRDFYTVALETTKLLGSLFPILAIALSLNLLLAQQRVPQELVAWMTTMTTSKVAFLIGVNILLLIIGCFMDSNSAILIVAPLIWPIADAFGIDKIHFGIIMTVNLEIGFLTPPVGLNLIVAMSAFRENFGFICRSVLPFIAMMLVVLALISWIPEISLSLVR
jgi:C4-dicarboxylate transporter DctM subunit